MFSPNLALDNEGAHHTRKHRRELPRLPSRQVQRPALGPLFDTSPALGHSREDHTEIPFITSRAGRPLATKCQWLDCLRSRLRLNREGSYYSGPQTDLIRVGQFADNDFIRPYTLPTDYRRPLGTLQPGDGQKSSLDRPVSSSYGPVLDPSPAPKLAGLSNEGSRSEPRPRNYVSTHQFPHSPYYPSTLGPHNRIMLLPSKVSDRGTSLETPSLLARIGNGHIQPQNFDSSTGAASYTTPIKHHGARCEKSCNAAGHGSVPRCNSPRPATDMYDVLPALFQCSNPEEMLRKFALEIPTPIGDVQNGTQGEQFTLQDVLGEVVFAQHCHAYGLDYQPPRTTTTITTKPLAPAPAPASLTCRRTADAPSSSAGSPTTTLTPSTSTASSPSPSPTPQKPSASPFALLREIASGMFLPEFLYRLDNLHANETPEELKASMRRYREWMMLSPDTRMEIMGTSTDPSDCYGAVRVVGEWRWRHRTELQETEGGGVKAKMAVKEKRELAGTEDVDEAESLHGRFEGGERAGVSDPDPVPRGKRVRWADRKPLLKAWEQ